MNLVKWDAVPFRKGFGMHKSSSSSKTSLSANVAERRDFDIRPRVIKGDNIRDTLHKRRWWTIRNRAQYNTYGSSVRDGMSLPEL